MTKVDLIASGYEWICTHCEHFNKEIEIPRSEIVTCDNCDKSYKISGHFHANE